MTIFIIRRRFKKIILLAMELVVLSKRPQVNSKPDMQLFTKFFLLMDKNAYNLK